MSAITDLINSVNTTVNANNNNITTTGNQFREDGFLLPSSYAADGNGLPYSKVTSNRPSQIKRNIITWFVPQFGTVKMYVNPQNITYNFNKLITPTKTKGGFTLQYWGEDLPKLTISGTTGSSGIEGINMLYEIYRAEQYAFDSTALSLANSNASADVVNNITNLVGNNIFGGGATNSGGALLGGILGLDNANNNLAAKQIPTLADMAFTVEMYYGGWVFRGFFKDFSFGEHADNFLMDYTINFIVTERRGYRANYLPFHRSPQYGSSLDTTPNSFSGNVTHVQNNLGTNPIIR